MQARTWFPVLVLAVHALVLGPGARAANEAPRIRSAGPARPPRTVTLQELWHVGGEDDSLTLGSVTEATCDPAGNVYLLDTQLCRVVAVSPSGEVLGTIGRAGDGPGEVRRPRDVLILPDGSVGLLEMFPAKIVKLSPAGEPRGTITLGNAQLPGSEFVAAGRCIRRGGAFVVTGQHAARTEQGQRRVHFLARFSDQGEELLRYREVIQTLDFRNLCFVEREQQPPFDLAIAVGPDDRVYVPEAWGRYAIEVLRPDGTLEMVIEREFENRKRSADELRRVNALYDASDRNIGAKVAREIEPVPPVIAQLHVDPEGCLWVLHSRSGEELPEGVLQRYDLFAPDGRYRQEVLVKCAGDPELDGLTFLPDGRVLLIKGYALAGLARSDLGSVPLGEEGEAAPLEIICCRMRG